MKKSGKDRLKCAVCERTLSTASAVPLPQWGRLRNGDTAFLDTTPFRVGKAKRRWLRRKKGKPTPPRCARQPLPREGARVDTPSFLWKEVPRRGGGWMEGSGVKKSEGDRLRSTIHESTLCKKQLIKPIYSYKKRKSNAANDFNVIYRSGYR